MPLPTALAYVFLAGLAASLAGRQELRVSPRPVLLTQSFLAYVIYACLVVVPASAYFYVFHGDWFLLYVLDVQRIPSAVALIGFLVQALLGVLGFLLGAVLVRAQRETIVGALVAVAIAATFAVVSLYPDRLARVGTYAQFHGQFGLAAFESDPLFGGSVLVLGAVALGLAFLLARVWYSGRHSAV